MEKLLGYDKNYRPIYEAKQGTLVTQAFILCSECSKAISSNQGPKIGSVCLDCFPKVS